MSAIIRSSWGGHDLTWNSFFSVWYCGDCHGSYKDSLTAAGPADPANYCPNPKPASLKAPTATPAKTMLGVPITQTPVGTPPAPQGLYSFLMGQPVRNTGPFLPDLDFSFKKPLVSPKPKYDLCTGCLRELSPLLDAYYGRDEAMKTKCVDCRGRKA